MDFSKIICIEVKKYNNEQLSKISEILGFESNPSDSKYFSLLEAKKDKVDKVFMIEGEHSVFALQFKKGVECQDVLYKDVLFIYPKYRGLSKKEKEKLLKVQSFDFFKKLKSSDVGAEILLDLDKILDKIGKFGINSLLKEEKEFLDKLSKE